MQVKRGDIVVLTGFMLKPGKLDELDVRGNRKHFIKSTKAFKM